MSVLAKVRLLAAPGLLLVSAMPGCDRVFYYPDRIARGTPADNGLSFEDVWFSSDDGVRLHGWFLPAAGGSARGTVLHLHGNAGNITGHYEFIRWLPAAGFNVLTFDYRGYGRSSGRVTREGTVRDALAALDYLRGRADIDAGRICLFGQSVGGAVAAVVTARRKAEVRCVVIDSAFTSYRRIVRHHVRSQPLLLVLGWWFPRTIHDGLDAIDAVAEIAPVPVLFMHGEQDRIVPAVMSRELYQAAREPRQLWLIEGMDHTEVWWARPREAQQRVGGFLTRALGASAAEPEAIASDKSRHSV